MADIQTPVNQTRINDPYQQRLYDFDTTDSRLYLARASNQLLKAFGNDIVLNGFANSNLSYTNDTVSLDISGGLIIVDDTLIEIDEDMSLDLNVAAYTDSGKVIVYTDYQWLQTVNENPIRIKMSHVSLDGTVILPGGWAANRNRVVLGIFEYSKNASNIVTHFQEITAATKKINVNGTEFFKCGYDGTSSMDTFLDNVDSSGLPAGVEGVASASIPPVDTNLLWLDTTNTPPMIKVYNTITTDWEPIQAVLNEEATGVVTNITEPTDQSLLWLDTSTVPAIQKYYEPTLTSWVPVKSEGDLAPGVEGTYSGMFSPTDQSLFWLDTSVADPILKYYDSGESDWVAVQSKGGTLSSSPPTNTTIYWGDTNTTPATFKYYDGVTWIPFTTTTVATISGYSEVLIDGSMDLLFDDDGDALTTIVV